MLSSGILMMKKGITLRDCPEKKNKGLWLWILGFAVNNFYVFPLGGALMFLPPHIVGAFSGLGLVYIILGSHYFLKEPLKGKDGILAALISITVVLIGLRVNAGAVFVFKEIPYFIFIIIPMGVMITMPISPLFRKNWVEGSLSGIFSGLAVVTLHLYIIFEEESITTISRTGFLLFYLLFSVLSFFLLQYGYLSGKVLSIIPGRYSFLLIYPALLSYPVLGVIVPVVDWLLLGVLFLLMSFFAMKTK